MLQLCVYQVMNAIGTFWEFSGTLPSCSANFPRASITRFMEALKHKHMCVFLKIYVLMLKQNPEYVDTD